MTSRPRDTAGAELNKLWRAEQARLHPKPQEPIKEPHIAPPATEKPVVVHTDAVMSVPVDLIDAGNNATKRKKDFPVFLKVYRNQVKAGQAVPILLQKEGARYRVLDGHRRLAAAKALGMETIRATVQRRET